MVSERSELLGLLLRYHALMHGVTDSKVQEALQSAIDKAERRLAELDAEDRTGPPGGQGVGRRRPFRADPRMSR